MDSFTTQDVVNYYNALNVVTNPSCGIFSSRYDKYELIDAFFHLVSNKTHMHNVKQCIANVANWIACSYHKWGDEEKENYFVYELPEGSFSEGEWNPDEYRWFYYHLDTMIVERSYMLCLKEYYVRYPKVLARLMFQALLRKFPNDENMKIIIQDICAHYEIII